MRIDPHARRFARILVALSIALPAAAQTTGRTMGRVSDGDGGYLAGAAVEVESPQTGVHSTKTDEGGRYAVPNLPPGSYTVRFRMEGYAPAVDAKMFRVSG